MKRELQDKIIQAVKDLELGDCCGIEIAKGKGLFIQVETRKENTEIYKEYFVELNDIDEEYCYEPCGHYNERVEFGNIDLLVERIKEYLKYHNIGV